MKVIGYTTYGDASVLQEFEQPMPTPGPTQVLIKTKYVSIHPVDTIIRSGGFASSQELDRLVVPGSEMYGEVVEVGTEVQGFTKGDMVIGKVTGGGYAEYAVAEQSKTFKTPANLDELSAASFSGVGITAYYSLFDYGQMKSGETVTILGASGGVGTIAIQLAKDYGLHVIAVASERNKEYVLSLGADEFIDYNNPAHLESIHDRADLVVDASLFAKSVDAGTAFAKPGARYVTLTRSPMHQTNDKQLQIYDMRRNATMPDDRAMQYLFDLHARKPLVTKPTVTFPFSAEGAKQAHEAQESGAQSKKILLAVE